MKKLFLLPALCSVVFAISSCDASGGPAADDSVKPDSVAAEAPKATFTELCKDVSKIAVTIKGYKYGMSGDFTFESAEFVVKESSLTWSNDSTALLTLKNYISSELVGDRKDEQIDINVELKSRHGKKIGPGTYNHSDYDADFSSFTTMITSKGQVYFNWVAGMPEQGFVKLDFIEGEQACGTFSLAVEKPDSDQIGIVRINGTFRTAE